MTSTLRQISAALITSSRERPPPAIDAAEAERQRERARAVLRECRERLRRIERTRPKSPHPGADASQKAG
jgi:hypothetical protein